jgi:uroporphyrinogen-III synthase
MLRFEAAAFEDDGAIAFDAVILSSANAVRAIENHAIRARLTLLPVFAVGEHTARVARDAGFTNITVADGDAISLRERIAESAAAGKLKKKASLCYLAGSDLSRDLAGELGARGFTVTTRTVYRMVPVAGFTRAASDAFRAGTIEAVLHYSRRSARALSRCGENGRWCRDFRLWLCRSAASPLRWRAFCGRRAPCRWRRRRTPDEAALLDALDRAVKASSL